MTTLLDISVSSLFCVSYEDLAEAISKPRTRAAIVATSPIPTITASFESELKWCSGKTVRSDMPSKAPPKTIAKVIELMAMELMIIPPSCLS